MTRTRPRTAALALLLLPALTLLTAGARADLLTAAPTPAATDAPAAVPYVLSPDDQVDVTVLGHPDYSATGVTLLPDGTFNYPSLGRVHAAGLTVDALTRTLTRGLSDQLNQPSVTVTLRQARPRRVSVFGDGVKTTGQYDYHAGMHLLDLIAAAGGPAGEPQLLQATLVTDGGRQSVPIPLAPLLTGTDLSQNLPLAPGDLLFLVARNPEVGQVQVVGEVAKPGAYPVMPDGVSLLALLGEAGGALPTSRLTEAQILHAGQVRVVNLRPLLTTDLTSPEAQVRLLPGDVLLVPANKNRILALGEVRTPGVLPLPDDQPLTLTTAYALVGGITEEGDKKNVDVIRRDAAGKTTLLAVNMDDLLRGKNNATDLRLQPGDILYVQTRNHTKSISDILSGIGSLGFALNAAKIVGL